MADNTIIDYIKRAAAETGADPAAMLATSLTENGARAGLTPGDNNSSYGYFQMHRGGALGNNTPQWATTYAVAQNRGREFARLKVHGGKGAAAIQRPADPTGYAAKVDANLEEARRLLGLAAAAPAREPAARRKVTNDLNHDPTGDDLLQQLQTTRIQSLLNSNAQLAGIRAPTLRMPEAAPAPAHSTGVVERVRPAGATAAPKVTNAPEPGGGWGGSHNLALAMAAIGRRNGLSIASEKRSRRNTTSGNMSDHYEGNKTAYAYDLSNGSSPTPQMDATAAQIAAALGVKNWKGGVLNVNRGGYRYQVLYRTHVGGNHFNHVHVGVRKL